MMEFIVNVLQVSPHSLRSMQAGLPARNLMHISTHQMGCLSMNLLLCDGCPRAFHKDVIGFSQTFRRLQDQRRESDIMKKLNFIIANENENLIDITLSGDCAEEIYGKKHEDMEPSVTLLVSFGWKIESLYTSLGRIISPFVVDKGSGTKEVARLCNGTRLQITQLDKNDIKAKALNDTSVGKEILIHRMDMNLSESKLPSNMTRRQFPIIISFAMK
ncbi:hypothetical protein K1719_021596 [Acacia pycnantha]|nr:hypothetical protein K1719_021596 [Acacia pycnantha]